MTGQAPRKIFTSHGILYPVGGSDGENSAEKTEEAPSHEFADLTRDDPTSLIGDIRDRMPSAVTWLARSLTRTAEDREDGM